jgi:hypothetical protein
LTTNISIDRILETPKNSTSNIHQIAPTRQNLPEEFEPSWWTIQSAWRDMLSKYANKADFLEKSSLAKGAVMVSRFVLVLIALSLCMANISCEKLEETQPGDYALKQTPVKYQDAIPEEYGKLVGVTSNSKWGDWAQLWFEKPDKTIAVVYVDFIDGKIATDVLEIPRR